jgi:hypothetical protein
MTRALEMRRVLARMESSGLTQKAFAKRERIPYSTLLYWRRRLRMPRSKKRVRAAPEILTPVRVVPDIPRSVRAFEVRTPDGLVVAVPPGFDAAELERLLGALSRC